MHSYCSSRRNPIIHDLVSHAGSLPKLQHGSCKTDAPCHQDKMDNLRVDTGCRRSNFYNINCNSSSSIKLSRKNASCLQYRSTPTAIGTWQQQLQCTQRSSLLPSSTWLIDDAPFCSFCLTSNLPITQCPAIPPQFWVTLINSREANLPSIARSPHIFSSWSLHRMVTPDIRSNPNNATFRERHQYAPPPQLRKHLPSTDFAEESATPPHLIN